MLDLVMLSAFPGLMIAAAISDVFTLRIPNQLTLILFVLFFVLAMVVGMPADAYAMHAAAGAIMLAVGFGLFSVGYIGGGDAKLIAVAALWLGLDTLLHFIFFVTLFGGGLAIVLISFRKLPMPAGLTEVTWLERLHTPNGAAPYGVAIGAGALIAFNQSIWIKLLS